MSRLDEFFPGRHRSERSVSLNIVYVFWLFFAFLCHVLPSNQLFQTVVSTIGLVILPCRVGSVTFKFSKMTQILDEYHPFLVFTLHWIVGSIVICSTILVASILPLKAPIEYMALIISVVGLIPTKPENGWPKGLIDRKQLNVSRLHKIFASSMLTAPIVYSLYILSKFYSHITFPYWLGVDQFLFNGNTLFMQRMQFDVSQTTGYFPVIESLFATVSVLCNITQGVYGLFWSAPILLYTIFSVGLFLLCREITGSSILAISSSLVGLSAFGGGSILDLLYFIPRNLIYSLAPGVLLLFFQGKESSELSQPKTDRPIDPLYRPTRRSLLLWLLYIILIGWLSTPFLQPLSLRLIRIALPFFTFVILFVARTVSKVYPFLCMLFVLSFCILELHTFLGSLLLALLAFLWFLNTLGRKTETLLAKLMSVLFLAFVIFGLTGVLNLYDAISEHLRQFFTVFIKRESISALWKYSFSFTQSASNLENFFSKPVVWLGLFNLALSFLAYDRTDSRSRYLTQGLTLLLLIYFSTLGFAYRATILISPLLAISASLSLFRVANVVDPFKARTRINLAGFSAYNISTRSLILVFLVLVMLLPLQKPTDTYLSYFVTCSGDSKSISAFGPFDVQAASWVSASVEDNAVIVGDLQTQKVICGLSGKMFTALARAYFGQEPWLIIDHREYFKRVYSPENVTDAVESMQELIDLYSRSDRFLPGNNQLQCPLYVVIRGSTRYPEGSTESLFPRTLDPGAVPRMFSLPLFTLSYQNPSYLIYKYLANRSLNGIERLSAEVRYTNATSRRVLLNATYSLADYPENETLHLVLTAQMVLASYTISIPQDWFLLSATPERVSYSTSEGTSTLSLTLLPNETASLTFLKNRLLGNVTLSKLILANVSQMYAVNVENPHMESRGWRLRLTATLNDRYTKGYYWVFIPVNDTFYDLSRKLWVLWNSTQNAAFVAVLYGDGSYSHVVPFSSRSPLPRFSLFEIPKGNKITGVIMAIDNRKGILLGNLAVDYYGVVIVVG